MNTKKLKSFNSLLATILFLCLGIFVVTKQILSDTTSAEKLYQQGQVLHISGQQKDNTGLRAIKVTGILPEPLGEISGLLGSSNIYLVEFENASSGVAYIGMEAKEGDVTLQKLLDKGENLATSPEMITVEVLKTADSKEYDMTGYVNTLIELGLTSGQISKEYFVSIEKINTDRLYHYGAGVVLIIFSIIGVINIIKIRKENNTAE